MEIISGKQKKKEKNLKEREISKSRERIVVRLR